MTGPLTLDEVAASYEAGDGRESVFRRVSLTVEPGEIVGLFGPNGCGKTTLLRVAAGLKRVDAGAITPSLRRVGWVPQHYADSFFRWLSLRGNIAFSMRGGNRDRELALSKLARRFSPDLDLSRRPSDSSGGMLQQAAILRAFAVEPTVILADEPFSALDVRVGRHVRAQFRSAVQESRVPALVVLHDPADLVSTCDRVLVITGRPFTTANLESGEAASRAILLPKRVRPTTSGTAEESFVELATRLFSETSV